MKKYRHRHRSRTPYQDDNNDRQRIESSIFTVLYNFTAVLVYGIFLKFSFEGTLALIMFSVIAALQLIICAIIGFRYNNKEWLISALVIFLIASFVIVYESM